MLEAMIAAALDESVDGAIGRFATSVALCALGGTCTSGTEGGRIHMIAPATANTIVSALSVASTRCIVIAASPARRWSAEGQRKLQQPFAESRIGDERQIPDLHHGRPALQQREKLADSIYVTNSGDRRRKHRQS